MTFVLAFSLVLGFGMNVFAADITDNGTMMTDISKSVDSEFSVLIPKKIELGEKTSIDFLVQAKGNIAPTENLVVTADAVVDMKRKGDETYDDLDAAVTLTECSWNHKNLTSEYESKSGSVTFEETKAGEYYGTGIFYINLESTAYVLMAGTDFNAAIPETATAVVFTDETAPEGVELADVSEAQNGTIMAWMDGTTYKVSTQRDGVDIIANTSCRMMFYNKSNLKSIDVEHLDTSKTENMYGMFAYSYNLEELDLSSLSTGNVTNMGYMFGYNKETSDHSLRKIDMSNFDMSKVTRTDFMFQNCTNLEELMIPERFVTSSNTNLQYMFKSCYGLESLNVSNWDTSSVTNLIGTFCNCFNLSTLDVENWNTSNVTTMKSTFASINSAKPMKFMSLDVSKWDTSKVTDMSMMFQMCTNLETIDVSNWDTSNVTDMQWMFCSGSREYPMKLKTIDVSKWDTGKVTDLSVMFQLCVNLETIDVSNWNTSNVTRMRSAFNNCHSVSELDVSGWDVSKVKDMCLIFQECYALAELDLSGWNTGNVEAMKEMFNGCTSLCTIKLGEKFSFQGNGNVEIPAVLPTPESGYWYDVETGEAYLPSEVPSLTAAEYSAVSTL